MKSPATKTVPLAVAAVLLATFAIEPIFRPRLPRGGGSVASLVDKLDSVNPDTVMTGYYYLKQRADPVAIEKAEAHLGSEEDYIWLNAAHYLGACGDESSVPYLIKALRHTASRADEDTVRYLKAITGQEYGADFDAWKSWWDTTGHEVEIDWTSNLGHAPRAIKKAEQDGGGNSAALRSSP